MNRIADIMLGAIRAQVCDSEYAIESRPSDEEMSALYTLSKSQDMAHVVASELGRQGYLGDDEISRKFKKQQMLAVLRYERINYELQEICRVLEDGKIRHMPLKGSVLRTYYPEPWMRTSADIDILIDEENAEIASEFLTRELGYENRGRSSHDIQMFSPGGVHLELHFETIEDERVVNVNSVLSQIWDRASAVTQYKYQADDAMFYFYHMAHMAKHFKHGGCGVRFFLDLWILDHKVDHDDVARNHLIEVGGIREFSESARRLSEVWFSQTTHNDMSRCMEYYVLKGNVYGSAENNMVIKQIKIGGHNKYVLKRIFLPYDQLKGLYPILEKHKAFTPIYEVRRWCGIVLRGRLKNSTAEIKQSANISDKERMNVEAMMKHFKLNNQ